MGSSRQPLRAVVFDVDGTLFDTLPSLSAAAGDVLGRAGLLAVPPARLRPALSRGLSFLLAECLAAQTAAVAPAEARRLELEFQRHYRDGWLERARPYAGVRETIEALSARGLRIGACTNRDRESTRAMLVAAGLEARFEALVGMGDTPVPKPSPEPLLRTLHALGVPPDDALLVGDSGLDCQCARACGVRFAAHLGGYASDPGELAPNVLAFDDYGALADWVLARTTLDAERSRA